MLQNLAVSIIFTLHINKAEFSCFNASALLQGSPFFLLTCLFFRQKNSVATSLAPCTILALGPRAIRWCSGEVLKPPPSLKLGAAAPGRALNTSLLAWLCPRCAISQDSPPLR